MVGCWTLTDKQVEQLLLGNDGTGIQAYCFVVWSADCSPLSRNVTDFAFDTALQNPALHHFKPTASSLGRTSVTRPHKAACAL